MTSPDHRLALPPGTRVQDFEFHRVLGHGGFGITYLGWNIALDIPVAIKEYLPADLALREQDMSVLAEILRGRGGLPVGAGPVPGRGPGDGPVQAPEHRAGAAFLSSPRHRLHRDGVRGGGDLVRAPENAEAH